MLSGRAGRNGTTTSTSALLKRLRGKGCPSTCIRPCGVLMPDSSTRFRFGRNWSSIVDHIGTRSVAQARLDCVFSCTGARLLGLGSADIWLIPEQVRSHAQKYFLKLQHQGRADAVPPPRPKRRSSKPYPVQQKTDKPAHQALPHPMQFCDDPSADLGSGDSFGGRIECSQLVQWKLNEYTRFSSRCIFLLPGWQL